MMKVLINFCMIIICVVLGTANNYIGVNSRYVSDG